MSSKDSLQLGKIKLAKDWLFAIFFLAGVCLSCTPFSKIFVSKNSYHYFIIQVEPDSDADFSLETVINVFANRLEALGVNGDVEEHSLEGKKNNQLIVKLYGKTELEKLNQIKRILLAKNKFELRKIVSQPNPSPITIYQSESAASQNATNEQVVMPMSDKKSKQSFVIVEKNPILTGADVRDATANSLEPGIFNVSFSLRPDGAMKFKQWTSTNIGNYLAVILDKKVRSAPFIKSVISDSGQIDGNFSKQEAEDLALILKSGYLPVSLKLIEENYHGEK